jgi:primosomal protein N' (replication factor Y)
MIASVIVDILSSNTDRVYDYTFSESQGIKKGQRVLVPFGGRKEEGIVIDVKENSQIDSGKLKSVIRVLEEIPSITSEMLELMYFMQSKYHILLAEALRLFIPSQLRGGRVSEKTSEEVYINPDVDYNEIIKKINKNAHKQLELLQYLKEEKSGLICELNKKFGSAVKKLISSGALFIKKTTLRRTPYKDLTENNAAPPSLTAKQREVIDLIEKGSPDTFLLFGVTGSGKTEIYLNLIEKALRNGKTAIMTVPEIALTPQVMKIFRARFGQSAALLHSGLSAGERLDEWNRLRRGEAKIAVGARSAVFAPVCDLGIIIIDEQHEQSYISENSPRFDAKEIAAYRAKFNRCSLVMGSATPLVESFYYAQQGKYRLVEIAERVNGKMPPVIIVDMRREVSAGNNTLFSSLLIEKIESHLKAGNQIMLFINRRGYSPIVICSECGYTAKCADCDATLNYHKADEQLKCHYCGNRYQMLKSCPDCGSEKLKKSGAGTQKVCDELKKLFPSAKVLRMDNDTTQNKEAHLKITESFADKKADILVGTQMIAKGHDFPSVTLVGVLDADLSLYFADYRSIERTFSLITQVAGRAGRADKEGEVILQTHTPFHYVYRQITDYDYKGFYKREISLRQAAKYPPFSKVIRVMVISDNEDCAKRVIKNIYEKIKEIRDNNKENFIYLNVMKSPVSRIKNKFRYQVLIRIKDDDDKITGYIYDIVETSKDKKTVAYVEINPSSLY